MLIYKDKKYRDFRELKKDYDFLSGTEIMQLCNCNYPTFQKIVEEKGIEKKEILLLPSNKYCHLYDRKDFEIVKKTHKIKNDPIPADYISKAEFCERLGLKPKTLNSIVFWCNDFLKYSEYFYVNNTKKRYFLYTQETLLFYKEKLDKYYNPQRKQNVGKIENITQAFNRESSLMLAQKEKFYRHHKIKIDKKTLSYMLDTNSKYYNILVDVYNHFSLQIVEDVSLYELHHIVPRFYARNGAYYPQLNSMENLIYLPPNIHFLVHFLEYKCALPIYRQEFFSSCCIKTSTLDIEKIEERYITEITDLLIKAFYR